MCLFHLPFHMSEVTSVAPNTCFDTQLIICVIHLSFFDSLRCLNAVNMPSISFLYIFCMYVSSVCLHLVEVCTWFSSWPVLHSLHIDCVSLSSLSFTPLARFTEWVVQSYNCLHWWPLIRVEHLCLDPFKYVARYWICSILMVLVGLPYFVGYLSLLGTLRAVAVMTTYLETHMLVLLH
jgi:hypothetical protein